MSSRGVAGALCLAASLVLHGAVLAWLLPRSADPRPPAIGSSSEAPLTWFDAAERDGADPGTEVGPAVGKGTPRAPEASGGGPEGRSARASAPAGAPVPALDRKAPAGPAPHDGPARASAALLPGEAPRPDREQDALAPEGDGALHGATGSAREVAGSEGADAPGAEAPGAAGANADGLGAGGPEVVGAGGPGGGVGGGLSRGGGAGTRDGQGHIPPLLVQFLRAAAQRCYPPAARRFRLRGEVVVAFCADDGGRVNDVRVIRSSGKAPLDGAVGCVLEGSGPLPIRGGCFELPVAFGSGG